MSRGSVHERRHIDLYKDPSYYDVSRNIAKTRHQVSHALAEFYTLRKDPIQKATWIYKYKRAIDNAIHNVMDSQKSLSEEQQQLAIQRALGPTILAQDAQRLKKDLYDILREIRDKEHMYRVSHMYKIILPPIPIRSQELNIYTQINELQGQDMHVWYRTKKYFIVDWDGDRGTCVPVFYESPSYPNLSSQFYKEFSAACCTTIKRLMRHFNAQAGRFFVYVVLSSKRDAVSWHIDDERDNAYSGLIFLPPPTAQRKQFVHSTQYRIPVDQIRDEIGSLSPRLQRSMDEGEEKVILRQRVPFLTLTGHAASVIHRSPAGQKDPFLQFNIEPLSERSIIHRIPAHFRLIPDLEPCQI